MQRKVTRDTKLDTNIYDRPWELACFLPPGWWVAGITAESPLPSNRKYNSKWKMITELYFGVINPFACCFFLSETEFSEISSRVEQFCADQWKVQPFPVPGIRGDLTW